MAKFLVKSSESVTYNSWVDADNYKDAIRMVEMDDGALIDKYSDTVEGTDFEVFEVEDENGDVVW